MVGEGGSARWVPWPWGCTRTAFPRPEDDEIALWDLRSGPHLRGANIYQRRVYPELDGPTFLGPGPFGPPYTQEDLNGLAAMGANYVTISHSGLFTENPPFVLDEDVRDNLDGLLDMAARADMFATISIRSGPGRSEFTFLCGDWFDDRYRNDSVWKDQAAQDAALPPARQRPAYSLRPASIRAAQVHAPRSFPGRYGIQLSGHRSGYC